MKMERHWCRIAGEIGYRSTKKNNMSLVTFLEPIHLFQTITLALSIFNLVTFLWLAITVWLNGDRRTWIARLGVVGLGFSAFFFFLQALLIDKPLVQNAGLVAQDFLWRLLWLPAICVPYIWFAIGLHYAALINKDWRRRRPALLVSSGILGCLLLVILILYQSTFTFFGTMRLLTSSDLVGGAGGARGNGLTRETGNDKRPRLRQALSESFWDDPTDVELLQEPILSWH